MHAEIHITRSVFVMNHIRQFIYPFVLVLSDFFQLIISHITSNLYSEVLPKKYVNDLISVDMSFN